LKLIETCHHNSGAGRNPLLNDNHPTIAYAGCNLGQICLSVIVDGVRERGLREPARINVAYTARSMSLVGIQAG